MSPYALYKYTIYNMQYAFSLSSILSYKHRISFQFCCLQHENIYIYIYMLHNPIPFSLEIRNIPKVILFFFNFLFLFVSPLFASARWALIGCNRLKTAFQQQLRTSQVPSFLIFILYFIHL